MSINTLLPNPVPNSTHHAFVLAELDVASESCLEHKCCPMFPRAVTFTTAPVVPFACQLYMKFHLPPSVTLLTTLAFVVLPVVSSALNQIEMFPSPLSANIISTMLFAIRQPLLRLCAGLAESILIQVPWVTLDRSVLYPT